MTGTKGKMKTYQECLVEATNATARPGWTEETSRGMRLMELIHESGMDIVVHEVIDLGPCPEAGSSLWSRLELVSFRLPDGTISGGWNEKATPREVASHVVATAMRQK